MPFVSVTAAAPIGAATLDTLQKEIGRIIALIPGKTIDNCMTRIEGGAHLFMSGAPAQAVFCDVRLRGAASADSKAKVTAELYALFAKELGAQKVYTNFVELQEWGSGPNFP